MTRERLHHAVGLTLIYLYFAISGALLAMMVTSLPAQPQTPQEHITDLHAKDRELQMVDDINAKEIVKLREIARSNESRISWIEGMGAGATALLGALQAIQFAIGRKK